MYVELPCSACGDWSRVGFDILYEHWKKGYEQLTPEQKPTATCYTEVTCTCGHRERYEGPMFQYIFCLIFDELVKKTTA